jgi:nucleotide-binding universal stress UspA family protein
MFQQILVPLDGSHLAEAALAPARFLAAALGARVTLIHVVEEDPPATIHGDRHLRGTAEAEGYLAGLRARDFPEAQSIACHVHDSATRDVALSIVEHQGELAPDLIVLTTHGRGGLRRLFAGSIAQQVVAHGRTPVLLIRPEDPPRDAPFSLRSLLAPTDGECAHEPGIDVTLDLACAIKAAVQLLSVAPTRRSLAGRDATIDRFMPGTTQAMLDLAEQDLRACLARHVTRFQQAGITVSAEILFGNAAPCIAEAAERGGAGMIVLATHGKAGNEAFWTNSVAARVQALTRRPLLLVPVKQEG